MAAPNEYESGYLGSLFALELDGVEIGRFKNVSGISYNVATAMNTQTNDQGRLVEYKSPGRVTFGDITMTRTLTEDNTLLDWHKTMSEGDTERKTGSIVMYTRANEEKGRWNFEGAWISSWGASPLDAGSDTFLDETITISIDLIERA